MPTFHDDSFSWEIEDELDKPLFCSACGKKAAGHWETEVDPWEFWGAKGTDHHEYFVSDCCNESLFDKDGEPHYEEVE